MREQSLRKKPAKITRDQWDALSIQRQRAYKWSIVWAYSHDALTLEETEAYFRRLPMKST